MGLRDEALACLQTWLLLVVLKGRVHHLRRWVETGGTGDRDTTWGRLLSESLPPHLTSEHYRAVRLELARDLERRLARNEPVLEQIVALPRGRGLRAAFEAALGDWWHDDVPLPRSGFPTFVRHAEAYLDAAKETP